MKPGIQAQFRNHLRGHRLVYGSTPVYPVLPDREAGMSRWFAPGEAS